MVAGIRARKESVATEFPGMLKGPVHVRFVTLTIVGLAMGLPLKSDVPLEYDKLEGGLVGRLSTMVASALLMELVLVIVMLKRVLLSPLTMAGAADFERTI